MTPDSSAVAAEPASCTPNLSRLVPRELVPRELVPRELVPRELVPREQVADLALLFRALAEPARLQLLSLLADSESGERCVCELTGPLGLSQPTVSHHLKVLARAGLITRTQRGTWAWFQIVPARFVELAAVLSDLGGAMEVLEEQTLVGRDVVSHTVVGQTGTGLTGLVGTGGRTR